MANALMTTYASLPVAFERGEGAWLWDDAGRKYLDAYSGVAVCNLGHAHPALVRALSEQAGRLWHTSNVYTIANQIRLAERLTEVAGMDRAFFCNSGAEANEAGIKLARLYGHKKGIDHPQIIVMERSFHGRTLATLSATGNRKVQAGFEPLVTGFIRVPYDDLEAVRTVAHNAHGIVAVLVEPVQGEGGVRVPQPGYLKGLREICDQHGWLLMFDEVQTGMGRTGQWFGFQHEDVAPDVLMLAKGIGNGFPMGACLARGEAAEVFQPGNHATTFGGTPLACAVGLAVLDVVQQDNLIPRVAQLGARMLDGLKRELAEVAGVTEIRGKGLMLGIELERPCGELVKRALDQGLLLGVTYDNTVRLLPPFVLTDAEADDIVSRVSALVRAFLTEEAA
ncbi:MAG: aspartate aminotransferase family protein [Thiohalomonadaceae bacterium]